MEVDKNMAEPVRNDEPLSSMRFPQSTASGESLRTGPVPVTRVDTLGDRTLPETAEPHAPIGEWPEGSGFDDDLRTDSYDAGSSTVENLKENLGNAAHKASNFLQGRARAARRRLEVIRGRAQSGELQEDLRARANDLAQTAQRQARVARSRAEFYARNYPVQFIGAAAAGAFAVGFLLRMWRDE
jgi:ElaB/YqjD/DUF883 family membrane-anchored ribosome-binding protein